MNEAAELLVVAIIIGAGGSALMDRWGAILRRTGVPTLDYALLGRWLGHLPRGRLAHRLITDAAHVPGERLLGWVAHYTIGVGFASLLIGVWGSAWVEAPTLTPALAVGLGTVVAPWFVMQPAMGAGIAGARTPNPTATRIRNVGTHLVYGLGVYLTALAIAASDLT